jgi:hypothetical protein
MGENVMTFVAFLIWVLIVAGTGYMLWKLIFEGRVGKKDKPDPSAVKAEQPEVKSGGADQPQEVAAAAPAEAKTPAAAEQVSEEEVLEGEVVEEEKKPAAKKGSSAPDEVKTKVERYVEPPKEEKPHAEGKADSSGKEK